VCENLRLEERGCEVESVSWPLAASERGDAGARCGCRPGMPVGVEAMLVTRAKKALFRPAPTEREDPNVRQ
jgi:hypothetical protein